MDRVEPYPLCWPPSRPRARIRKTDRFGGKLTAAKARDGLYAELGRLGATHVIVSTDCPLKRDGRTFYAHERPDDPGVAVFFRRKGIAYVMALDTYHSFAANLRALSLSIDALRAIERHGSAALMEQAFRGFKELPPSSEPPPKSWWEVLCVPATATLEEARVAYRAKLATAHPDKTGEHDYAAALGEAMAAAKEEYSNA